MKTKILAIDGKIKGDIELPRCFNQTIREDLIKKSVLALQSRQPYGNFPLAGKLVIASGAFSHRRRAHKGAYGLGISRIPRKIMSARGSRFVRVGAFMPGTRGGRQAHPPKVEEVLTGKINKKEKKMALNSSIAATASIEKLRGFYPSLNFQNITLPLVVENKIKEINKTKNLKEALGNVLGEAKSLLGKKKVLIISDEKPKISFSLADFVKADEINIKNFAPSGKPGRLVIYTEGAIKKLGER